MKKLLFTLATIASIASCFAASKKINNIAMDDKIQLQSTLEFSEDGAWVVSCTPVYSNLVEVSQETNSFGNINTTYKYDYVLSSYKLNKQLLDNINGFTTAAKPAYSVIPVTSGIVAVIDTNNVITANKEGAITIVANDNDRIMSKSLAFKTYANGNIVTYYTGDTNDYVNALYTEWYGYLANRSKTLVEITGYNTCNGYVAGNDFVYQNSTFTYYLNSKGYNTNMYIPTMSVCFRMLDINNAIKYSGNAIGTKVSLNSNAYGDIPESIYVDRSYTHKWMKATGDSDTCKVVKASNLAVWAKSKATYLDTEIAAVADTVAYVYDTEIPTECQASILRTTIRGDVENDAPNSTNCLQLAQVPGFSISQHGTVVPQYFTGVSGYNDDGSASNMKCSNGDYRHDGIGVDTIDPYHSGHIGDSGRPWFLIYGGESILLGCYHHANDAYSYGMGWRIIRDFCKENGSTCNLYDMINKTKIVVTP